MVMAVIACPHCDTKNSPGSRFCNACGYSLANKVPDDTRRPANAERRILTVLFCDLIDSTVLVDSLDPELSRTIIRDFQHISKKIIENLDGRVSTYLGDGIIALFTGHESNAESAINTALQINREMAQAGCSFSESGQKISVRCGIATGLAVVGDDMLGNTQIRQETAVGLPLNMAARIQGLASPGGVAIGATTHNITRGLFEFEDIGEHELKGIKEPQRIWRVLAEKSISSRFVAHAAEMTPMVDRKDTLNTMLDCWENSRKGIAQTIVFSGEAGVGKSRITQEFSRVIALSGRYHSMDYQCSPYHTRTALYPVASRLKVVAGFLKGDSEADQLDKIETLIRRSSSNLQQDMPAFIDLLSLSGGGKWPAPEIHPDDKKEWIFNCLINNMLVLSLTKPILIRIEDVHWIDPSTLELTTRLIRAMQGHSILLLITARPEFSAGFMSQANVLSLEVERLPKKYSKKLLDQIKGHNQLPDNLMNEIIQRTEGIPLFIEELSKNLIESLPLPGVKDSAGKEARIDLPETLQDSLLARLDCLPKASRSVAHLAAVIGRDFSYDLLENIAGYEDKNLYQALTPLLKAQLVLQQKPPPYAEFSFKHSLVRDVAYETLLKSDLIDIHRRIAVAIETEYPDVSKNSPELIAHHFTEGQEFEKAVEYWLKAGMKASRDSASVEARSHLEKGLSMLTEIKNSKQAIQYELKMLLALGPIIMSIEGTGAEQTHKIYMRAFDISNQDVDADLRFVALWNRWRISIDGGFREVAKWADELLVFAQKTKNVEQLLQAHHCHWGTLYNLGKHRSCCEHIDAGIGYYDETAHCYHASTYGGHDPKVCGYSQSALSLWLIGDYQKADARIQKGQVWADRLDHLGTNLHQVDISLMYYQFCNQPVKVLEQIEKLTQLIDLENYQGYSSKVKIYSGWAQGSLEHSTVAQTLLQEGLAEHVATGTWEDKPVYLEMSAQLKSRSGDYAGALKEIEQALESAEVSGVEYWTAELYRRKAQWVLADDNMYALERAIEAYLTALEIASEQSAATLELRAAIGLADIYKARGEAAKIISVLAPVQDKFPDDAFSQDIQQANLLLQSAET